MTSKMLWDGKNSPWLVMACYGSCWVMFWLLTMTVVLVVGSKNLLHFGLVSRCQRWLCVAFTFKSFTTHADREQFKVICRYRTISIYIYFTGYLSVCVCPMRIQLMCPLGHGGMTPLSSTVRLPKRESDSPYKSRGHDSTSACMHLAHTAKADGTSDRPMVWGLRSPKQQPAKWFCFIPTQHL